MGALLAVPPGGMEAVTSAVAVVEWLWRWGCVLVCVGGALLCVLQPAKKEEVASTPTKIGKAGVHSSVSCRVNGTQRNRGRVCT